MNALMASPALAGQPAETQQLAMEMQNDLHHCSGYRVESVAAVNGGRIVFKAFKRNEDLAAPNEYIAIKGVVLDQTPKPPHIPSDQKGVELEMQILRALSSSNDHAAAEVMQKNIVHLEDSHYTHKHLFLVTQWCEGGDLFDYLHKALQKNSHELSSATELHRMGTWFSALASSVALVHRKGLAHRDLSPENVLIGNSGNSTSTVKLHDFGLACAGSRQKRPVGKLMYAAPELMCPAPNYDPRAADIWSLGIILFSMMSKHVPMNSAQVGDAHFQAFCKGPAAYVDLLLSSQKLEHTMSAEAKDLFLKMANVNPAERITIEGVLQHPFVCQQCDPKVDVAGSVAAANVRCRSPSNDSPQGSKWGKDAPKRVRQKVHQTMRELAGAMLKTTAGGVGGIV
jgi:serine/threonine protein kinase